MVNSKLEKKRKICFPITSRAYYARQKLLLTELQRDPRVKLDLILAASVLLDKYSKHVKEDIEASGFTIAETQMNVIDGGNHVAMAKTACITALEMTNTFHKLNPDIVVVTGDRFEQLAIAMAAAYLNKSVAHIEGGDVTGSIDESVRHAITKLAHFHFVANSDAHRRVIQMGENPNFVFNVGSLDVEAVAKMRDRKNFSINRYGVGENLDLGKQFLMALFHPVTTEPDQFKRTSDALDAIATLKLPTLWFWPNADAGTNEIAEAIRHFREQKPVAAKHFRFITNVPANEFAILLRRTACLVGNSSSGIKEGSFLGTPVVNIGSRQDRRMRGPNVIDVSHGKEDIQRAIRAQLKHGRYAPSGIYHKPGASKRVAELLATLPLYTQKIFHTNGA